MGSGNSSPVKQAKSVETEAHQDVFEIRFDHLALGGTAAVFIIVALVIYWLFRKRQKNRERQRLCRGQGQRRGSCNSSGSRSNDRHQRPCYQNPWLHMMPTFLPMTSQPPFLHQNSWFPMDVSQSSPPRFMEIRDTGATPVVLTPPQAPARPPPPLQCPSPPPRKEESS